MKKGGILLIAVFAMMVLLLGCRGAAQTVTPGPTVNSGDVTTFSGHGLSFAYPQGYLKWEEGLLDDKADVSSGVIQVAPDKDRYALFAVSWVKSWPWGLEGGLEAGFDGVSNWESIRNIEKGPVVETTKIGQRMLYQIGHRMLHQYYTASNALGERVQGIVGAFYCEKTQRTFSLVTMKTISGTPSSVDALRDFGQYLDYFMCH